MTSGTPTSKPEQQTPAVAAPVGPKPEKPWWRRWMEPILAVTIIAALLTALVTGGAVAFQSLKGDIHASETRVSARIDRLAARMETVEASLREDIQASEARQNQRIVELKDEIQASEARQNQRIVELKDEIQASEARQNQRIVELKDDLRVMDSKLDRVLEALPAAASPEVG